ncbi:unnamed protein product, partial [Amoebophrya sp. A120]
LQTCANWNKSVLLAGSRSTNNDRAAGRGGRSSSTAGGHTVGQLDARSTTTPASTKINPVAGRTMDDVSQGYPRHSGRTRIDENLRTASSPSSHRRATPDQHTSTAAGGMGFASGNKRQEQESLPHPDLLPDCMQLYHFYLFLCFADMGHVMTENVFRNFQMGRHALQYFL